MLLSFRVGARNLGGGASQVPSVRPDPSLPLGMTGHMSKRIYTIGHSTRALPELIALLEENGVARLADIRRFPGSRRYPHFSREALSKSLPENGIAYEHFEDLGGRRKVLGDS